MNLKGFKKSFIFLSFALSLFFSIVFYKTVYTDFDRIRIQLLESPIEILDGQTANIAFTLNDEQRRNTHRLVFHIRNQSVVQRTFTVFLNSEVVAGFTLPAGQFGRFIVHLKEKSRLLSHKNRIKVKGDDSGWKLERCEISNYYASARGLVDYIILHRAHGFSPPPSYSSCLVLFLVLFAAGLPLLTVLLRKDGWSRIFIFIIVLMVVQFTIALLLPVITDYKLKYSIHTFLIFALIAYLPVHEFLYRWIGKQEEFSGRRLVLAVVVPYAIALFFLSSMLYSLRLYGDYSGFLQLSTRWTKQNPLLNERPHLKRSLKIYESGYDAQFMYFIAFDPFLQKFSDELFRYRRWIDNPPYRYGRIGYPLLAKIFSWNQPDYFAPTMIYLIVASHFAAALFLVKIALHYGRSPLWALFYPLIPAFHVSLRVGLPESVAAAFLIAGAYYFIKRNFILTSALLACSLLIRETGAVLVLVLSVFELIQNKNKRGAGILLAALLPIFTWKGFLIWKLFYEYGFLTIPVGSKDIGLPLAGIVQLWSMVRQGEYVGGSGIAAVVYPAILISGLVLAVCFLRKDKGAFTVALLFYAVMSVSFSFVKVWTLMMNGERVTFEIFVFIILVFLGLSQKDIKIFRPAVVVFFGLVLVYDLFFLSVVSAFRAGFGMFSA